MFLCQPGLWRIAILLGKLELDRRKSPNLQSCLYVVLALYLLNTWTASETNCFHSIEVRNWRNSSKYSVLHMQHMVARGTDSVFMLCCPSDAITGEIQERCVTHLSVSHEYNKGQWDWIRRSLRASSYETLQIRGSSKWIILTSEHRSRDVFEGIISMYPVLSSGSHSRLLQLPQHFQYPPKYFIWDTESICRRQVGFGKYSAPRGW